jgi:hypothetical protein
MAWRSGASRLGVVAVLLAGAAALLAADSFLLRPLLDARVLRIIAGESVPPSRAHQLYIAIDALRLVLILAAGFAGLRRLAPIKA